MRIGATDAPAAVVSSNVLVALVDASGAIDAAGAAGLERELGGALDAGATRVIVDLTRAGAVTTAGMNALLAARQRVLPWSGEVAVVVPPRIEREFRTLGLDRRFVLASDRADAARRLGLLASPTPTGAPAPRYANAA
jgi:anti-anti-sigma regulatory factor